MAQKLGVDITRFQTETIPVIFSISFKDPGGYFLATKVLMRNQDVLYVSNAPAVEVVKFLQFLRIVMATAGDGIATTNGAVVLRNNLRIAD